MRLSEFTNRVGDAFEGMPSDPLVIIKDKATKVMYEVSDVTIETHEDGDGSTTLWIEVEEL